MWKREPWELHNVGSLQFIQESSSSSHKEGNECFESATNEFNKLPPFVTLTRHTKSTHVKSISRFIKRRWVLHSFYGDCKFENLFMELSKSQMSRDCRFIRTKLQKKSFLLSNAAVSNQPKKIWIKTCRVFYPYKPVKHSINISRFVLRRSQKSPNTFER